jgi:hypothetical protein
MRDHHKIIDALPPGSSCAPATRRLIEGYAAEIAARHAQLLEDRDLYRSKLDDLRELDPADFTGLTKLYRAHLGQIEVLLKEFERPALKDTSATRKLSQA